MTPDFSADMLKSFLRIRVGYLVMNAAYPAPPKRPEHPKKIEDGVKARIRKAAGVTAVHFDMAWHGRALSVVPRARLWGALGIDPADYGIRLLDLGKQERAA